MSERTAHDSMVEPEPPALQPPNRVLALAISLLGIATVAVSADVLAIVGAGLAHAMGVFGLILGVVTAVRPWMRRRSATGR